MQNSNLNPLPSWKPRSPSPTVERRLFGRGPHPARADGRPVVFQRWLAPAALALTLVVVGFNPRNPALERSDGEDPNIALALAATSNQLFGAYLAASEHSRYNGSSLRRFGWTSAHPSPSSMRSFPVSGTNQLLLNHE